MERKFKVNDFVKTERGEIGIVGWIENLCINLPVDAGHIGIDLLTHNRGFMAPVDENKCAKSSIREVVEWYGQAMRETEQRVAEISFKKTEHERMLAENKLLKELLSLYLKKEA